MKKSCKKCCHNCNGWCDWYGKKAPNYFDCAAFKEKEDK